MLSLTDFKGWGVMTNKSTASILAGHIIERYEVILYGFYASFLAYKFFPFEDKSLSILFSFGAFASGFLARPLGGLIIGYIGDRYGRKIALLWSMLPVTLITLAIGCLPTYQEIGLYAPISLITLRLMQGFFVGGEFAGALTFFYENAQAKSKGRAGAIICASGFLGALIAAMMAEITTSSFMPEWGWRIGFFFGGIVGLLVFV